MNIAKGFHCFIRRGKYGQERCLYGFIVFKAGANANMTLGVSIQRSVLRDVSWRANTPKRYKLGGNTYYDVIQRRHEVGIIVDMWAYELRIFAVYNWWTQAESDQMRAEAKAYEERRQKRDALQKTQK